MRAGHQHHSALVSPGVPRTTLTQATPAHRPQNKKPPSRAPSPPSEHPHQISGFKKSLFMLVPVQGVGRDSPSWSGDFLLFQHD